MSEDAASRYAEGNIETGVGATMIALGILVVGLRFYARVHLRTGGLGWDDWLALVALVASIIAALLVLVASIIDPNSNWIQDNNTDPDYHYTPANETHLLLAWIASVFYFSCVSASKLSILMLYDRLFSASRAFHLQVIVLNTVVVLFWIATTFATIFDCWPMKWSWISSLSPAPYCFNFNIFWFATGIIEALLDFCVILLPVRMIMRLQMSMRKRISLVGVFSLGAFGIITGIVKVYHGYAPGKRSPNWNQTETWAAVHASTGAGGMGIICSCLPTLWPLVLKVVSKAVPRSLFSSRTRQPGSSRSGGKSSGNNNTTSLRSWWRAYKHSHGWSLPTMLGPTGSSRQSRQKRAREPFHFVQGEEQQSPPLGGDDARRSDTKIPMLPIHIAHINFASQAGAAAVPDEHALLSRPSFGSTWQQVRIWSSRGGGGAQPGSDEQPTLEGIYVDRTFSRTSQRDAYPNAEGVGWAKNNPLQH